MIGERFETMKDLPEKSGWSRPKYWGGGWLTIKENVLKKILQENKIMFKICKYQQT